MTEPHDRTTSPTHPHPRAPADSSLSPAQRSAVEHDGGPLIVLAGPGTGKTRVITHRIAHLIRECAVEPESVVAVTFTVKAAEQMRERLRELIGSSSADRVWASTFHSLGLRILQRFGDTLTPTADADARKAAQRIASDFRARRAGGSRSAPGGISTLIDSAQQTRLLRRVIRDLNLFRSSRAFGLDLAVDIAARQIAAWSEMAVSPEQAAAFAHQWRSRLDRGRSSADLELDEPGLAAERERLSVFQDGVRAFAVYEAALRELGLFSFADLINLPTRLLSDPASRAGPIIRDEWRHVVVDEFQDANPAQIEMLRALAPPSGTRPPDLCVVGDDDQSIYGFRGADDRAFTRMSHLWGEAVGASVRVVELSDNYRSTAPIVQLASSVIARAHSRFKPDKTVRPAATSATGIPPKPAPRPALAVALPNDSFDAQAIAALVRLHTHAHPPAADRPDAEPTSFAVVVRSNSHAIPIAAALRQEGITVRTAHTESAADDPGVQDVLSWCRVLTDPTSTVHARRLLARPPVRWGPEVIGRVERAFEAAFADRAPAATDGYLAFVVSCPDELLGTNPEHARAAVARLIDVQLRLAPAVASEPASEVVRRIITATGIAHAELMSPADRAARVQALVAVLRFAIDVQPRLDQPGDLRALLSYYDDLSSKDQGLGSSGAWGDIEERLEGPRDIETAGLLPEDDGSDHDINAAPSLAAVPAVTILTAHKAKGLEFDVVFVPRLGRTIGQYSATGKADHVDESGGGDDLVPAGLMTFVHPGERTDRSPSERIEDEARRLFYVACTRAKSRLFLLSKQNKGKSSGMHFFEEVLEHERPAGLIELDGFQDVMSQAAEADVLHATSTTDGDLADSADGDDDQERLDRARRDVRLFAAEALDLCEHAGGGSATSPAVLPAAAERLSLAAQRMHALGALARALREGSIDPASLPTDDRFITRLAQRLGQSLAASGASSTADPAPTDPSLGVPIRTPGLKPPLRLSYSQINEYNRCPRCYYLRRVLGLPEEEGEPEVVGRVVHKAIELFTRKVRGDEADLAHLHDLGPETDALSGADGHGLPTLRAIGHALFRKAWPTNEPVDKEQLERLDILLNQFFSDFWNPGDHTVEIEHKVTFDYIPTNTPPSRKRSKPAKPALSSSTAASSPAPADPAAPPAPPAITHTIQAVIDRVDLLTLPDGTTADRIVDYKTGRDWKMYTEPDDDDLQMGIYALALAHGRGVDPSELRGTAEYWLIAGRTRGTLDLSELRLDKVRAKIDKAIAGMLAGDFPIGKDHLSGRHGPTDCMLFEPEPLP